MLVQYASFLKIIYRALSHKGEAVSSQDTSRLKSEFFSESNSFKIQIVCIQSGLAKQRFEVVDILEKIQVFCQPTSQEGTLMLRLSEAALIMNLKPTLNYMSDQSFPLLFWKSNYGTTYARMQVSLFWTWMLNLLGLHVQISTDMPTHSILFVFIVSQTRKSHFLN